MYERIYQVDKPSGRIAWHVWYEEPLEQALVAGTWLVGSHQHVTRLLVLHELSESGKVFLERRLGDELRVEN